jgi:DNA processing protein
MTGIEPIIAMLNDNQSLNQTKVLRLFTDILSEMEASKLNKEILESYLKIQTIEDESRYHRIAQKILNEISEKELNHYEDYLSKIDNDNINFVPFYADAYPDRLRSIPNVPLCLYVNGDLSALSDGVAVVGTRDAYDHRIDFAKKISDKLVQMNKTVVSGLAKGIDAAAHRAALDANGETVAILPGDVQKIRPSSNRSLAEKIPDNGALVGEVTYNKRIHKGRFVERNRITSGISSAVVIGASGETGGTVRQAEFAQEQRKSRLIYAPEDDDGQSPSKIYNMGFASFNTVDEMEELINTEVTPSNRKSTFDDFEY